MDAEEGQSRTDNKFLGKNVRALQDPNIPSKGDMLSALLLELAAAETEKEKKKAWRSVLDSCFTIWDSNKIPTTRRCNALKYLRNLYNEFQAMKPIYDRADSINRMSVLAVFRRKMSKFFLIGAENADAAESFPAHLREPFARAKIDNPKIVREEKKVWARAEASSYDVMPDNNNNNNNDAPMNRPNPEKSDLQAPLDQAAIDEAYREALKDEPELLEALGLLGDGPMAAAEPETEGVKVGAAAKNAKTASKPAVKRRRAADAGLDAESSACSTNRAEGFSGLAGADAGQTSPSQGTFVGGRQPSPKKPRLETPMEQDEDTGSSRESVNLDVTANTSSSTKFVTKQEEIRQLETHENPADSLDTAEKAAAVIAQNSTGQHEEKQASPLDGASSASRSTIEKSMATETAKEFNAENSELIVEEQLKENQVAKIVVDTPRHTAHREEKESHSLKEASSASRASSVTSNATETTKDAEVTSSPVKTAEDEYCLVGNKSAKSSNDAAATQTVSFEKSLPTSNSIEAASSQQRKPGGCAADEEDEHVNTELLEKVAEDEYKRDSLDGTKASPDPDTSSPSSTALKEEKEPSLGDTLLINCTCSLQQLSYRSTETPSATETREEDDESSLGEISTDDDDDQVIKNARGMLKRIGEEVKALNEHTLASVGKMAPTLVAQLREGLNLVAAGSALSTKRARRRRRGADEEDDPRTAAKKPRLELRARHDEEGSPLDSTYTGVSSSSNSSSNHANISSDFYSDSLEIVTRTAGVDAEISTDDEKQQVQMIDEVSIVNRTATPQPRHSAESPTHPRQDHPQCGAGPSEHLVNAVDVNGRVLLMSASRPRGYTALHFAVDHNLMETAKNILERKPDALYTGDSNGITPLQLAERLERTEMINLFLSYDKLR